MNHTNDILVIDRDQWARGRRNGATYLLHPTNGSVCCLGFDALQLGVPEADVIGCHIPYQVKAYPKKAKRLRLADAGYSGIVKQAMAINDDENITDAERERKLIPVLKALGWNVVIFVGGSK